jgi:hypothetical protein
MIECGLYPNAELKLSEATWERLVRVWDKPHTITVYKTSKTVWVAVGEYNGQHIEVKDRSLKAAEK